VARSVRFFADIPLVLGEHLSGHYSALRWTGPVEHFQNFDHGARSPNTSLIAGNANPKMFPDPKHSPNSKGIPGTCERICLAGEETDPRLLYQARRCVL
jgi:hypothetical protein